MIPPPGGSSHRWRTIATSRGRSPTRCSTRFRHWPSRTDRDAHRSGATQRRHFRPGVDAHVRGPHCVAHREPWLPSLVWLPPGAPHDAQRPGRAGDEEVEVCPVRTPCGGHRRARRHGCLGMDREPRLPPRSLLPPRAPDRPVVGRGEQVDVLVALWAPHGADLGPGHTSHVGRPDRVGDVEPWLPADFGCHQADQVSPMVGMPPSRNRSTCRSSAPFRQSAVTLLPGSRRGLAG